MSKIDMIIEGLKVAPPEVVEQIYALMQRAKATNVASRPGQQRGIDDLIGVLKNSPAFEGDPVEIQRAMRREWD
jgi:hypothetical protein